MKKKSVELVEANKKTKELINRHAKKKNVKVDNTPAGRRIIDDYKLRIDRIWKRTINELTTRVTLFELDAILYEYGLAIMRSIDDRLLEDREIILDDAAMFYDARVAEDIAEEYLGIVTSMITSHSYSRVEIGCSKLMFLIDDLIKFINKSEPHKTGKRNIILYAEYPMVIERLEKHIYKTPEAIDRHGFMFRKDTVVVIAPPGDKRYTMERTNPHADSLLLRVAKNGDIVINLNAILYFVSTSPGPWGYCEGSDENDG